MEIEEIFQNHSLKTHLATLGEVEYILIERDEELEDHKNLADRAMRLCEAYKIECGEVTRVTSDGNFRNPSLTYYLDLTVSSGFFVLSDTDGYVEIDRLTEESAFLRHPNRFLEDSKASGAVREMLDLPEEGEILVATTDCEMEPWDFSHFVPKDELAEVSSTRWGTGSATVWFRSETNRFYRQTWSAWQGSADYELRVISASDLREIPEPCGPIERAVEVAVVLERCKK